MVVYDYISIEGFLVKVTEVREPHNFQPFKAKIPWHYCKRCGLIRLNNKVSLKQASLGCMKIIETVVGKV